MELWPMGVYVAQKTKNGLVEFVIRIRMFSKSL